MGKLDGKVALVTGGARGQGRSHAIRMAEEGAQIIVCDIADQVPSVPYQMATEDDLAETVKLVEALDQRCLAVQADARSAAQLREVVERGVAEFGRIDIAAINHGICVTGGWDTPEETIDDVLDINLKGAFLACQAVIPQLIEQGDGGSIVLTASVAGLTASYGLLGYGMSKFGVVGLTKCLSAELAAHRIRVNAVCPGAVDTPMVVNEHMMSLFSGLETGGTRETADLGVRGMALMPDAWLDPRDISNAVCFLASDEARFITGIAMPVDLGTANQPAGIPPIAAEALAAAYAQHG